MSIATEITRLQGAKDALKTAIEGKGVQVPSSALIDAYPDLVDQIQQGGGGALMEKDVNFYDYDGTLVEAWTLEELASATSLPSGPVHAGLTFQSWNWTLADLKSNNNKMNVGAHYITSDGKTRLYITIPSIATSAQRLIPLIFTQPSANAVSVDWGDGSPVEKSATSGKVELSHQYATSGDYVISFSVVQGTSWSLGASLQNMFGNANDIYTLASSYLKKAELGYYANSIGGSPANAMTFKCLPYMETITIPAGCKINNQNLDSLASLKCVVVASGTTTIPQYALGSMPSCEVVCLPKSCTQMTCTGSGFKHLRFPKEVSNINLTSMNKLEDLEVFNATLTLNACPVLKRVVGGTFNLTQLYDTAMLEEVVGTINLTGSNNAFVNVNALRRLNFTTSLTAMSNSFFNGARCLEEITIPASLTSFGNYSMGNLLNCKRIRFERATPPTFSSSNAFQRLNAGCVISVPVGSLNAYKTATNYPNPSTYTYIEE